jgi:hypothetical protein
MASTTTIRAACDAAQANDLDVLAVAALENDTALMLAYCERDESWALVDHDSRLGNELVTRRWLIDEADAWAVYGRAIGRRS